MNMDILKKSVIKAHYYWIGSTSSEMVGPKLTQQHVSLDLSESNAPRAEENDFNIV